MSAWWGGRQTRPYNPPTTKETTRDEPSEDPTLRAPRAPQQTGLRPAAIIVGPSCSWLQAFGQLAKVLGDANTGVVNGLGRYYVLIVVGFVAFALYAAFSQYGDITLGKDGEKPQYSVFSPARDAVRGRHGHRPGLLGRGPSR